MGSGIFLGIRGSVLTRVVLAAQVVSGIGFLGAGTIIIQKLFVRGVDHGCRDMGYFCHWTCSWSRAILAGESVQCC